LTTEKIHNTHCGQNVELFKVKLGGIQKSLSMCVETWPGKANNFIKTWSSLVPVITSSRIAENPIIAPLLMKSEGSLPH
jgi:hypothetical protein